MVATYLLLDAAVLFRGDSRLSLVGVHIFVARRRALGRSTKRLLHLLASQAGGTRLRRPLDRCLRPASAYRVGVSRFCRSGLLLGSPAARPRRRPGPLCMADRPRGADRPRSLAARGHAPSEFGEAPAVAHRT